MYAVPNIAILKQIYFKNTLVWKKYIINILALVFVCISAENI